MDPAIFYSESWFSDRAALARATCRRCDVQMECLTAAVEQREYLGIWGGTSSRERLRQIAVRSAR